MANHRLGLGGPVADSLATEMVPGRTGEFADLYLRLGTSSVTGGRQSGPHEGILRPSPTDLRMFESLQPRHLHKCVPEP